ncbi:MAG: CorA family divalent cation transporter [Solirubrobacteraceae bacterium]
MQLLERVDPDAIRALHERDEFFWLDLYDPGNEALDTLAELIEIPALAVEDTKEFGQRPKVDDYGQRVLVVFYGADGDAPIEVHVHLSGREVVTVRRGHCAHLGEAHQRVRDERVRTEEDLVYRILDALADSIRALVDRRGVEVQSLEDRAFERPTNDERRRMSELRSELFRLQQVIVPQRDMLDRGFEVLECIPGLEREAARHPFRDVHDDLVLTANEIDYNREVLAESLNVLINQMAGRLTIVATIFLPLTFATGFFGMNFGWLVNHIDSLEAFLVFGVGGMVMPIVIAAILLVRAGYFGRQR